MTQEDKDLLLKDLCARLPYGVKVMKQFKSRTRTLRSIDTEECRVHFFENDVNSPFGFSIENPLKFKQQIKPYLRPMSSMTEEEKLQLYSYCTKEMFDTLNKTNLDWVIRVCVSDGFWLRLAQRPSF